MMKKSGSKLFGAVSGKPVQAAGMSLYWSIWGGQKFYNQSVVDTLVLNWNATLIRAAIAADNVSATNTDKGYVQGPANQLALARKAIDAAIARDVYVLVDWHDHNANLNVTQAKQFFDTLATLYGNKPNVIWEIWNEPDGSNGSGAGGKDSWADIKNYANQVIPVIRAKSSNLIVVGTPTWSQDVDVAAADQLTDANVAYTLHFYAGTHGAALRTKAGKALAKGAALFITEFGTTTADGGQHPSVDNGNVDNYKTYPTETKAWLDWADLNGISWANWSMSSQDEASAALLPGASTAGKWTSANLTESGTWMRNRLRARVSYASAIDSRSLTSPHWTVRRNGAGFAVDVPAGVESVNVKDLTGRNLGEYPVHAGSAVLSGLRSGTFVLHAITKGRLQASQLMIIP